MGVQSQNTSMWFGWRTSKVLCSAEAEPIEKENFSTFVLVLAREAFYCNYFLLAYKDLI